MIKTQVQIPDHLYQEAKRISKEYEMSFAEVVRRGIERVVPSYPPRKTTTTKWRPPTPRRLGSKGLNDDELKDAAQTTSFEETYLKSAKLK